MTQEQGPQELSADYKYFMYRDILNSEPVITVKNIHTLLALEAKALEETKEPPQPISVSEVLEQWNRGSRFLALQFFLGKTEGVQLVLIDQKMSMQRSETNFDALGKFFARCTDTLLNAPLFPGRPDRYDTFMNAIAANEPDPEIKALFINALAYNKARFGDEPDTQLAEECKMQYDALHTKLFPLTHTY